MAGELLLKSELLALAFHHFQNVLYLKTRRSKRKQLLNL